MRLISYPPSSKRRHLLPSMRNCIPALSIKISIVVLLWCQNCQNHCLRGFFGLGLAGSFSSGVLLRALPGMRQSHFPDPPTKYARGFCSRKAQIVFFFTNRFNSPAITLWYLASPACNKKHQYCTAIPSRFKNGGTRCNRLGRPRRRPPTPIFYPYDVMPLCSPSARRARSQ